jgi:hypothetical protein
MQIMSDFENFSYQISLYCLFSETYSEISTIDQTVKTRGICSSIAAFLFGSNESHLTSEIQISDRKSFLEESGFSKCLLNVLAMFIIVLIAFLCGFYH